MPSSNPHPLHCLRWTFKTLTDHFAIPGVLAFDEPHPGMTRAVITAPACKAELYLQGAHLTQWQPTGHEPVLFLSERSLFTPGKAIRGGIPIIFPWFGNRTATAESPRTDGPSHGFARTADWTLAFAALSGEDLTLTLALGPSNTSRDLGFDQFQLAYQLTLGTELRLQLTVANLAETPLHFEEAFHTYLSVGDAQQISLIGLSDTAFIDKTDAFNRKRQIVTPLTLTGETDRPLPRYPHPHQPRRSCLSSTYHHRQIQLTLHCYLESLVRTCR